MLVTVCARETVGRHNVLSFVNSQGAEIFPFSYFENPWLECDLAIKDMKNIHNFHKTRTYGLNLE